MSDQRTPIERMSMIPMTSITLDFGCTAYCGECGQPIEKATVDLPSATVGFVSQVPLLSPCGHRSYVNVPNPQATDR